MEMVFLVYAAITFALLVLHLLDYLVGHQRAPLIERKWAAPAVKPAGVAADPVSVPPVQYDRAA